MPTTTTMFMATVAAGIAAAAVFLDAGLLAPAKLQAAGETCATRTERYELSSQPPFYLTQPHCGTAVVTR